MLSLIESISPRARKTDLTDTKQAAAAGDWQRHRRTHRHTGLPPATPNQNQHAGRASINQSISTSPVCTRSLYLSRAVLAETWRSRILEQLGKKERLLTGNRVKVKTRVHESGRGTKVDIDPIVSIDSSVQSGFCPLAPSKPQALARLCPPVPACAWSGCPC